MSKWMVYGANGFTGKLIAEVAKRRGLAPVLAGRSREAIESLANELEMESRVFALSEIDEHLAGIDTLVLAAGPFGDTSEPAFQACLKHKVNYLDITGEIPIFEAIKARDSEIKEAGIVALPGIGFDVVPTDCLAAKLKEKLSDATTLELAFSALSPSKGTTKTMLARIDEGGCIREDGKLKQVPSAYDTMEVAFADKGRHCICIPWGDVSTAHHSTGIENIRVYMAAKKNMVLPMKAASVVGPLLKQPWVQSQLGKLIDARVKGPSEEDRATVKSQLWGRVRNAAGDEVTATLTTMEAYQLTAESAVEAAESVANVDPGYHTPSSAFGSDYVARFEGSQLRF